MRLQPKHIPNILTIFRMALVPIIVVFMLVPFGPTIYSFTIFTTSIHLYGGFRVSFTLAGILFAIACITDWLDGFLARKNK
jgi:CDP-diacylglycerol--glycerol-3-phosphate 3-phosphatidyltransferase